MVAPRMDLLLASSACTAAALKVARINAIGWSLSLGSILKFTLSDICVFAAFFALLQLRRRRLLHVGAVVTIQLCFLFWLFVSVSAAEYFGITRVPLEYPLFRSFFEHLSERARIAVMAAPEATGTLYGVGAVLVLITPWLGRRASDLEFVATKRPILALPLAVALLAVAVAVPFRGKLEAGFVREPLLHVGVSALRFTDVSGSATVLPTRIRGPREATDIRAAAPTRNVVIVLLETTGAAATTVYNRNLSTTPFLADLAARSAVVRHAYAVIPHTSKSLVSVLCGFEPKPGLEIAEAGSQGMRGHCLADVLRASGYQTAMFQTATERFESGRSLIGHMGYAHFWSGDQANHAGFHRTNYFGYADEVMLPLVRRFLAGVDRQKPFHVAFLTNAPHHDYRSLPNEPHRAWTGDGVKNRWLDLVAYQDRFLHRFMDEFHAAGLLDSTIFVFVGDHGEGFGEHSTWTHDDVAWNEGLRVPLVVYDPQAPSPTWIEGPRSQIDIVPTVLKMAGFAVPSGSYEGTSVFEPTPNRELFASCLSDYRCLVRLEGSSKYIYNFGIRPDELYDLAKDPHEQHNLLVVGDPEDETRALKARVLGWRAAVVRGYDPGNDAVTTPK